MLSITICSFFTIYTIKILYSLLKIYNYCLWIFKHIHCFLKKELFKSCKVWHYLSFYLLRQKKSPLIKCNFLPLLFHIKITESHQFGIKSTKLLTLWSVHWLVFILQLYQELTMVGSDPRHWYLMDFIWLRTANHPMCSRTHFGVSELRLHQGLTAWGKDSEVLALT